MPRREPRWVRKRARKAGGASSRPEPRFGVTDYVPGPARAAAPADDASPGPGGGADGEGPERRRRWRLPLAMLVTGLVVGAGGVGALVATGVVGPPSQAAPAPEPTATAVTVTVPDSCAEAGRLAEQVVGITQEIVAATGELDAARLQVLVDQLQQLDPRVRAATAACRQDSPTLSATTG